MVPKTYAYTGRCHWTGKPPTDQIPTSQAEVASNLDAWYDAGRPQFIKEAIRKIQEQMDNNPKVGERISVVGLDGVGVEFEVETGKTRDYTGRTEYAVKKLFIRYCTVKQLKYDEELRNFQSAYCTLQILNEAILQDEDTKRPIPDPRKTLQPTRDLFKKSKTAWEESEMCEELKDILKYDAILPHGIRKIIGLALGSFTIRDAMSLSQDSASQHALLLTLLHTLQEKHESIEGGATIACFSQDPAHTSSDKKVLLEYGIQPLDDPQAILEIDESSVVVSTAPDLPLKEIVADIARPAILIWDRVGEIDEEPPLVPGIVRSNHDSPRVREMINKYYDTFDLPAHNHFCDVVVYVRKTLDDTP